MEGDEPALVGDEAEEEAEQVVDVMVRCIDVDDDGASSMWFVDEDVKSVMIYNSPGSSSQSKKS